jgi:lycopene cyclase domain-containing protein
MNQWLYLVALLISLTGLAVLDHRFKLAYWIDKRRTLYTIGSAVLVFIVWDLLGIWLGIFFHGESSYSLPFRLLPEFPVEELFFLTLLSYVTLLVHQAGSRLWPRT